MPEVSVKDTSVLLYPLYHHNEDDVMCGFHNGFIITGSEDLLACRVTEAWDSQSDGLHETCLSSLLYML